MKKLYFLISLILCAVILAATAFAADTPDAYSLYNRSSKNLDSAASIEMSGTIRTSMEMEGVDFGAIIQNSTITLLNLPGGDIQMEMCNEMNFAGETVHADAYYKDGYMYTNAEGETSKAKLDIEGAIAQANAFDTGLTKDAFKDATVEQTDEGTLIKFKINFDELTKDGSSFMSGLDELGSDSGIQFGDVTYSMLVGTDNNLKGYDMDFNMDITVDDVTIKTKNKASYKILWINRVDSIDFPADLAAY